ncbi:MAG: thiazole synthase [Candidatus Eremiobacteraeota bacterium]|nr:thiazole synthase [Candidatus Eremiobacteraeota bacterium]
MQAETSTDALRIGKYEFRSRLFVGTGKYPSLEVMQAAHAASGAEVVTVAIRRMHLDDKSGKTLVDYIDRGKLTVLPNTAGCYTAKDAVLTAKLAREALGTDLIKVEVIGDAQTLYPDTQGTITAAEELVRDGFTVLPYIIDDPVACKRLEDVGCAAVMPLAAPIGSGLGVCNPYSIRIIKERATVPVIVDAGVGTASDATLAMELGIDALLMNTGIAAAADPVRMARAMKAAVEAGRDAFLAGRMPKRLYANASSPMQDLIATKHAERA